MKVWKRCFLALLAFIIVGSSVCVSQAAGTLDTKEHIWTASAADIVAEYYGLSEKEAAVLCNGAVQTGMEYRVHVPHQNGTEGKEDLIAVDYLEKKIYAKEYASDAYTWLPTEAVLVAEGEEKERLSLTAGSCFYHNVEYNASTAFTYSGSSYTVYVNYQLTIGIDGEEQNRLLTIPSYMIQVVGNLEKDLKGMRLNMKYFGQMLPYLKQLMDFQFSTEDPETGEIKTEPAFDETEDAELMEVVDILYEQYMEDPEDPGLTVYKIIEDYRTYSRSCISYSLDHGTQIQTESESLYGYLDFLDTNSRLSKVYKELKTADPQLYQELRYFYQYLNDFLGTARKPGPLVNLKDPANWMLLNEEIKSSVLRPEYDGADFTKLENAAYALRNASYQVPEVQTESFLAVQMELSCDITIYDVNVTASAKTVAEGIGNDEVQELPVYSDTVTLLEGTSAEDVEKAVRERGVESHALEQWKINTAYYKRTQTVIKGSLVSDVEYGIWYEPNYYTVKTDFMGRLEVPYGYLLEFPESTEEDGWYDYYVEHQDGTKDTYNQGAVYMVSEDVSITRTTGTEKEEYRVFDFLAEDTQYNMNHAQKSILLNPAVNSPSVKIRKPDESRITEITETSYGYELEAEICSAGVAGMDWEPYKVVLMKNDQKVDEITLQNGEASWKTGAFTHVNVIYHLNITKVKDGLLYRKLEQSEIYESVNLPHTLVTEAVQQNQVLGGDEGITAKTVYQNMKAYEGFMSMLPEIKDEMQTEAAKDALTRIQGSEDENIKGSNGASMGCGGWSSTSDELAFFKYLKLCEDSGWSLATYYQKGYYTKLKEQSALMADCLDIILKDPGTIALLELFGMSGRIDRIEALVPELKTMSANMNGPHGSMNVNHPQFSLLIEELLAAEGQTRSYSEGEAASISAYSSVTRNGKNVGTLTITVRVGNQEQTAEFGYVLDEVRGSVKYHRLTSQEASAIGGIISELEVACGLEESKKTFYTPPTESVPEADTEMKRSSFVTLAYMPKTYTVRIEGVPSSEYMETFQYGSDYVIDLPAKSRSASAGTYYRYIFKDRNEKVLDTRAVENGTTGSYRFEERDLSELFLGDENGGTYTIFREEMTVRGTPGVTLAPTLSTKLIRGAQIDSQNGYIYLDVNPEGMTKAQFLKQVPATIANATLSEVRMFNLSGEQIANNGFVGNGTVVEYILKDDYGKEVVIKYKLILMGDVDGDGRNTQSDIDRITAQYFVDTEKGEIPMQGIEFLAANMNNNKKIDSNDAWKVKSKSLYWNADPKKSQIEYRSVLN